MITTINLVTICHQVVITILLTILCYILYAIYIILYYIIIFICNIYAIYYMPWFVYCITGSLNLLVLFTSFSQSPNPVPSVSHQFVLCIYESISVLFHFFYLHVKANTHIICLFLSDLFHYV